MPPNFKQANAAVNAAAAAVCALLNGGTLRIYDGTQPATANTAPTGAEHLLAELTFGAPAFGAPAAGVAVANAVAPDTSANAGGTATWFRAVQSDGTPVFDGSVGLSGCDCNLNSTVIVPNAEVSVTSMSYTQPKAV